MSGLSTVALAAALLVSIATPAHAQFGRVTGTVKDESGRAIRGATIVATNPAAAPSTLTASTDQKGRFALLGFRRGMWTFSVSAPGFHTVTAKAEIFVVKSNPPMEVTLVAAPEAAPPGALANVNAKELQQQLDAAEALAHHGDLDGAVAAYRSIHTRVPALTSVLLQIAFLHERKQESAAALAAYRQLAAADPGNERARSAIDRLTRTR